jgi:hypothetical protein
MEHIGLCKLSDDKQAGELLPDLVITPAFTVNQIQEYAKNDPTYPGQLRLAAAIANIGYGPMEIKGTKEWACGSKSVKGSELCPDGKMSRLKVKQVVYSKQGDSVSNTEYNAGTMYFDNTPGHNHYHVDDWVEFRLVKITNNTRVVIANGHKVSYCLFMSGIFYNNEKMGNINGKQYGETMPNYGLGSYPTCNIDKQGIGVGGYDAYGLLYEGQYIDLPKGLKNGEYVLEIQIDPHNWYRESNKNNNVYSMSVNISKQEQ